MTYSLRAGTPDDFDQITRVLSNAFLEDMSPDEVEIERRVYEPERTILVHAGSDLVGTAGAFTRDLTVPGATVPAAYVTIVSVAATHRRRGLLTRMMQHQLREVRAAGREPVAVLWASEGRIYQRFGYGLASKRLSLRIDSRDVRLTGPDRVGVREITPENSRAEFAHVYERQRPVRPGFASRNDAWWSYVLADPPSRRQGSTTLRGVLAEGPDGPDGYALWRSKGSWEQGSPNGTTLVHEVVAATPDAYTALWRFLLSIDLTRQATYSHGAVDEPMFLQANEPRKLGADLRDGLWLRIVDVPSALSARRYAAPVDTVIDVVDELLPENSGRWRLTGDDTGATCTSTDEPAQVRLDVSALGTLYLGGATLGSLATAGRLVVDEPGLLPALNAAFGWYRAPAAIEVF